VGKRGSIEPDLAIKLGNEACHPVCYLSAEERFIWLRGDDIDREDETAATTTGRLADHHNPT